MIRYSRRKCCKKRLCFRGREPIRMLETAVHTWDWLQSRSRGLFPGNEVGEINRLQVFPPKAKPAPLAGGKTLIIESENLVRTIYRQWRICQTATVFDSKTFDINVWTKQLEFARPQWKVLIDSTTQELENIPFAMLFWPSEKQTDELWTGKREVKSGKEASHFPSFLQN